MRSRVHDNSARVRKVQIDGTYDAHVAGIDPRALALGRHVVSTALDGYAAAHRGEDRSQGWARP